VVRATIRQGWLLSREVQQMVQSVREDLEDVTAEALLDTPAGSDERPTSRDDGDSAHRQ
jgi:hypothetical protein